MNLTPQQAAFRQACSSDGPSLRLDARAGTGKSTSIAEGVTVTPNPRQTLVVAFNSRIKSAMEKRLPDFPGQILTFNGLGHRAWQRNCATRLVLNSDKIVDLVKALSLPWDLGLKVRQLATAAKARGLVPKNFPGVFIPLAEDSPEVWEELAWDCDLEPHELPMLIPHVRNVLAQSIIAAYRGSIDFTDQIVLPLIFRVQFPQFSTIFVDEAQDLSPQNHHQISRSLARNGRVIAVGDEFQSIYGFRGADTDSMNRLSKTFSMDRLPLSVSFRCPKAVVREAQNFVPDIEAAPSAPEGEVRHLGSSWALGDLPNGATVLCRNTAPLISLAFRLLASGRPAQILGGDIGRSLINLLAKIAGGNDALSSKSLGGLITHWEESQISLRPRKAEQISERAECLRAICEQFTTSTIGELKAKLGQIFSNKSATLTLSTIHKSKGLEWPEVFLLDSWRMPSKWATTSSDIQQEHNCHYVAITRAQQRLTYIDSGRPA